jgi:CheY-like chemotaxis protein
MREAPDQRLEILVVDDVATIADALVLLLTGEGMSASAVYSGPDAMTACGAYLPDLVLLDFAMPGMNGAEVADKLFEMPESRRPRIVIHTSLDLGNPRIRHARCDRLLHKSYRTDELAKVLREVVARKPPSDART